MLNGYSLAEVRKSVVAAVVAALALAGYFVAFDPNLEESVVAVIIAGFNVAGVFLSTNWDAYDAQKAVQALTASVLALLGFFVTIEPSTGEAIAAIALGLVNVVGVFKAQNANARVRGREPLRSERGATAVEVLLIILLVVVIIAVADRL